MSGWLCVPTFCGGGRGGLVEGRVVRRGEMEEGREFRGGLIRTVIGNWG